MTSHDALGDDHSEPDDPAKRHERVSTAAKEAGAQAGVVAGTRAVDRAANARLVAERIERTHARQLAKGLQLRPGALRRRGM